MKIKFINPPIMAIFLLLVAYGWTFLPWQMTPFSFFLLPPIFGKAFIVAGAGIMIWAALIFRKKGTTINPRGTPSVLVTDGPFRFTRNPMYLGTVFIMLGIAFLSGEISFYIVPMAYVIIINTFFIRREEKILESVAGDTYTSYKTRVRRWL